MDKRSFAVLGGVFFTLSFSVAATAALIPSIAAYFGESSILTGRLIWAYMLPYGLFALVWSPLTTKLSVKRILLLCTLLFSASSLLVGSASSLSLALAGRLGMGIFGSCFVPLSLIVVGKEAPLKKKPKYLGFLFSIGFASSLLGVFLSGFVSWRIIYFIPFFAGVILSIASVYFLKDFDYRRSFKVSYVETFKNRAVLKLFSFIFIASFLYHSIQQWLGVYLAQVYSFNQILVSFVFTVSSLAAICSENLGGLFASRLGAGKIAFLGLLAMGFFVLSLIIFKAPKLIFFMVIFWGLGWAFNHVGLSTLLTNLPDKFLRNASSLNSSLRFLSGGLGVLWGGRVISQVGFNTHFLITFVLMGILGVFLKAKLSLSHGGKNG